MNHLLQTIPLGSVEGFATSLSSALLAGLWQGIALALLTVGVLKFLPGTTATARFLIWSTVFASSAAMPFLHLMTAPVVNRASSSNFLVDARWSYVLAALWLAAASFRLFILAVEATGLRHIWRTAEPVAPEVLQRVGLESALAERRVEVCTTQEVDRPSVIGFFAPRILIPDWLLAEISDTELRHIVLHEMEHLRRRDDWLNLLQKVGLVLFPLNPALFWIDRRLTTEREIACDDGVLARTHTARAYATSLTSIAERHLHLNSSRRMVALALGAFGARRSEFAVRIESILGQRAAGRPALAAVLVAGVLGGTAAMSHAPDLVTFGPATSHSVAAVSAAPDRVLPAPRAVSPAAFENASYRVPDKAAVTDKRQTTGSHARVRAIPATAAASKADRPELLQKIAVSRAQARQIENQWMVLTSWEQNTSPQHGRSTVEPETGTDALIPVSRVVVRTPDGRFFATPYAAVPTQAGWLIVQL